MSTSHDPVTSSEVLREEKGRYFTWRAKCARGADHVADLGFKAVYLTGAGLTNMYLGLPDLGFPWT